MTCIKTRGSCWRERIFLSAAELCAMTRPAGKYDNVLSHKIQQHTQLSQRKGKLMRRHENTRRVCSAIQIIFFGKIEPFDTGLEQCEALAEDSLLHNDVSRSSIKSYNCILTFS